LFWLAAYNLNAYEAGTEANNELAEYVPGPPFGSQMCAPPYEKKIDILAF
jgi:hypothetical protein